MEDKEKIVIDQRFYDNYYRVLVINEGDRYVVSVDVYLVGWRFPEYKEECIDNTCLLLAELTDTGLEDIRVAKIFVIGIRVGDRAETINVKWVLDKRPDDKQLERIYRQSWIISKGRY